MKFLTASNLIKHSRLCNSNIGFILYSVDVCDEDQDLMKKSSYPFMGNKANQDNMSRVIGSLSSIPIEKMKSYSWNEPFQVHVYLKPMSILDFLVMHLTSYPYILDPSYKFYYSPLYISQDLVTPHAVINKYLLKHQ